MGIYSARIYEVNLIVHLKGVVNPAGTKRYIGSFCIAEAKQSSYAAQKHPVLEHTIEHSHTKVIIE